MTRRGAMVVLLLLLVLIGGSWYAWWEAGGKHVESTDNAYVGAPVVAITPQSAGTVVAVFADDNDYVAAGQALVRLDATDARLAVAEAEASLAAAVRDARLLYAGNAGFGAVIAQREAELAKAEADLARREPLVAEAAVSREERDHARAAVASSRAQLERARDEEATHRIQSGGIAIDRQPAVQKAAGRVEEAHVALARMVLRSPIAGHVARRNVQVGQRIAAGTPLMAVVALDRAWVDANFKEVQLEKMRIGQPVELTADLYGGDVKFRGTIAGFAAGTGGAFALLPQNASGNWIKVTQRVPVRVMLDPAVLRERPLQVGLSMRVRIDLREGAAGPRLAAAPRDFPAAAPDAPDPALATAQARVRAIVAEHSGPGPRPPR